MPGEKPLFSASNFQNSDEDIVADDLGLNKLIDGQLSHLSVRGADAPFNFIAVANTQEAYSLSGGYTVAGDTIIVKAEMRQNNELKYMIEVKGTVNKLHDLAIEILEKTKVILSTITNN